MEKIPNLNIGDQEFQKVGEMKAEKANLKSTPKSFDLYQDTESGALVGELPHNHPNEELSKEVENKELERKVENLNVDFTQLSIDEVRDLLLNEGVKIYGRLNVLEVVYGRRISGPGNNGEPTKVLGEQGELKITKEGAGFGESLYKVSYKDILGKYVRRGITVKEPASHFGANIKVSVIDKNEILIEDTKIYNHRDSADTNVYSAEVSFYEIPKGYKELVEKKEGKAE